MEPNRKDSPHNNGPQKPDGKKKPNWLLAAIIAVAAVLIIGSVYNMVRSSQYTQTTFSDFLEDRKSVV